MSTAAGKPAPLGHHVHQAVHAVVEVDVGVAGLAVQRLVAPRRPGRGVAGGVRLADVGLGFDDHPGGEAVRPCGAPAPSRAGRGRRRAWADRRTTARQHAPARRRTASRQRGGRARARHQALLRSRGRRGHQRRSCRASARRSTRERRLVADDAEHLGDRRRGPSASLCVANGREFAAPPPGPARPGSRTCPTRAASTLKPSTSFASWLKSPVRARANAERMAHERRLVPVGFATPSRPSPPCRRSARCPRRRSAAPGRRGCPAAPGSTGRLPGCADLGHRVERRHRLGPLLVVVEEVRQRLHGAVVPHLAQRPHRRQPEHSRRRRSSRRRSGRRPPCAATPARRWARRPGSPRPAAGPARASPRAASSGPARAGSPSGGRSTASSVRELPLQDERPAEHGQRVGRVEAHGRACWTRSRPPARG